MQTDKKYQKNLNIRKIEYFTQFGEQMDGFVRINNIEEMTKKNIEISISIKIA
jgi:hypothetical protein